MCMLNKLSNENFIYFLKIFIYERYGNFDNTIKIKIQ